MRDSRQESCERPDSFLDVFLLVLIVVLVQVLFQLIQLSLALKETSDVVDSVPFMAI